MNVMLGTSSLGLSLIKESLNGLLLCSCCSSVIYSEVDYQLRKCVQYHEGGIVVQRWGCGHAIKRSQVRSPAGHCCGQVVHTHVPLSPSSIVWYRCKSWGGRLWKRCGLPSLTLGVSPLPAKDQQNGDDEHCTLTSHGLCLQLCYPLGYLLFCTIQFRKVFH